MSNVELLLCFISFELLVLLWYVRWIYEKVEYRSFEIDKPVNQYGENLPDAIQNGIARGQRGITTYD